MNTFDDFWPLYPKRDGVNPKAPARTVWDRLLRKGVDPQQIINGVRAFHDEAVKSGQIGTEFIPHARTWLNQRRYEDYTMDEVKAERIAKLDTDMAGRGYKWNGERWERLDGASTD